MPKAVRYLAVAAALFGAMPALAGTLIVGGDITPTFALGPPEFGGVAGNIRFYDNVRGGASRVVLSDRGFHVPGFSAFYTENLRRFYGGTPGVTVVDAGDLTTAALDAATLLVIQFPDSGFSAGEIAAVGGFVRGGGRLFVSGEASIIRTVFPGSGDAEGMRSNVFVNDLLGGIGATIHVANDTIGCCGTFLVSAIANDPLTSGVTAFQYGAATSVIGGTSLLFAPTVTFPPGAPTRAFFATETLTAAASVPEPATWALLIGGFACAGLALRRARSVQRSLAVHQ